MGRSAKYQTEEEAKQAQKEQIKKSNQKYQAERKEFRRLAYTEQLELVKLLNKHVIHDKEFLAGTLMIVQEYVDDEIAEPEGEELVDEKGETTKNVEEVLDKPEKSHVEEVKEEEKKEEKKEKPKRKYVRKNPPKKKETNQILEEVE
jgi:hypothetical protein